MGIRVLVVFLVLVPTMVFPLQEPERDITLGISYRCPPCGCAHDIHVFGAAGLCPGCAMELVPVTKGLSKKVDTQLAPFLEAGMLGQLYTKLIYPVFAIGILLSLFFLCKSIWSRSLNVFLAGSICIVSLYGFKNQLYAVTYGLTNSYKSLFVPVSFIVLLGPMVWLYIKSLVKPHFPWKPTYWFHFVPAAAYFVYYTLLLLAPEQVKLAFLFSPFEVRFGHLEQILAVLLGLGYTFQAFRMYRDWKKETMIGNTKLLAWILRFLIGTTLLFLSWGVMIFLNFWLYDFGVATVSYNPLWLTFGLFLLWLGMEVFSNSKFFLWHRQTEPAYGSKSMDAADISLLKSKLHQLMADDKLYLNTDLSLDILASELGLPAKQLSSVLNGVLGNRFYDFVNHYRINEVKARLRDPNNRKLTIEAIANQSGFKSKSSFNAAFKKQLGMTPREFIKKEA